jgi:fumarate hydratase class I
MAVRRITLPLTPDVITSLATGDKVIISGRIVTARDKVHKHLASGGTSPVDLTGLIIYHCGPVMKRQDDTWQVTAAGPTTSMREEPYQADIIERFHPGAIMGKGGMGEKTQEAMRSAGCVYLHLAGGAAQFYAQRIIAVEAVHMLEFGQPEAMWILEVKDLPALVTMDCHGRSLHKQIENNSFERLQQLLNNPPEG